MKYSESGKVGDAGGGVVSSDCGKVGRYSPPSHERAESAGDSSNTEVFSVPATDALSTHIIEQNRSVILKKDVVDPHTGSFSARHNGLA